MNQIWTEDPELIRQEIELLIANKVDLICGRRGAGNLTKLSIKGTGQSKAGDLIILYHPHEPTCKSNSCVYYYHIKGQPLRFFEVERVKQVNKLLGLKFPTRIFNIHRRNHERVTTPPPSRATFSLLNKQRVHTGKVDDISMAGAKLTVEIASVMAVGDLICHLSLILCSHYRTVEDTQIQIPEARVIWLKGEEEKTTTLGVQFQLVDKGIDLLSNYIDQRNIEISRNSPFQPLPSAKG